MLNMINANGNVKINDLIAKGYKDEVFMAHKLGWVRFEGKWHECKGNWTVTITPIGKMMIN